MPGWSARRSSRVAVVTLAATAAAVVGVWATVVGNSGPFGRLTGLVGVCLLLLAVVIAAVAMFAWAQHPVPTQYPVPARQPQGTQRPAPDLMMVPMPMSAGVSSDTGSFPVVLDAPRQPPESEPQPDPMAELEAVWAAEPDGISSRVLELMSVLSAAGVRRDLIYAAGQAGLLGGEPGAAADAPTAAEADADAAAAALGQLAERSLLSFSRDGRVVSADRPVLRAVRDRLAVQDRLVIVCRAAASVLEARCEALAGSPNRLAILDLPDQVRALRDVVAGLPGEPDPELAGALLRLRGWTLYLLNALGDQAQRAIVIGEPLVADTEWALGPDDPDTLAARNNLANAYRTAGRTDEAIALHEQALAGRERVLGPDHPHTVQSRKNLAAAYRAAGRTDEAIADVARHEQALADRERALGLDDPDTLAARNNLALAYQTAGRTDEAIALHEQALADRERVLGTDHPGTLNSRSNLAVAYQAAGRTDEAVALHKQVLADRERVLGPDHPDTLAARNNLANAYRAAGRP
jgi:tetratricopeptide (TPR) repeat protein